MASVRPQAGSATAPATVTSTTVSAQAIARGIRQGARGEHVKVIQSIVGVEVDGRFGPRTKAAVRAWQRTIDLPVSGVVNPESWAALRTGIR